MIKYIILILFLALFGQGINANKKTKVNPLSTNEWCVNSKDIVQWKLIDKEGNAYLYTKKELMELPKEDYDFLVEHLRVKAILFGDYND